MAKNVSAKYYQEKKKNYKKQLLKDTKIFLKRKVKKPQYGCERYKNLSEDEKQELVEHRKEIL